MAQGPSDTILAAIRITLRIRESKVRNLDPPDRRRFVLSEHSFLVFIVRVCACQSCSLLEALTCVSGNFDLVDPARQTHDRLHSPSNGADHRNFTQSPSAMTVEYSQETRS